MTGSTFRHTDVGTSESVWLDDPRWAAMSRLDLGVGRGLRRVVLVAAHPDDETLGASGLLQVLARHRIPTVLVLATSGESSHPGSPTHSALRLGRLREAETRSAVHGIHPDAEVRVLQLPDGRLSDHQPALRTAVTREIGDLGPGALVVAPWRHDGHPDHETAGAVAVAATRTTGAALLEYPIWLWHWGSADDLPWDAARALPLDAKARSVKQGAVGRHTTQVEPLSEAPGDEVLLPPAVLAHFERDREVFLDVGGTLGGTVGGSLGANHGGLFERLHSTHDDPWGLASTGYESDKRQATLALLPDRRFARVFEPGCSVGVMTRMLADRSDAVVAWDVSQTAVARARERCADLASVRIRRGAIPGEWPEGLFDLVVLSEIGYFLDEEALLATLGRTVRSLGPDGMVLLCHWRHPVDGWSLDGEDVHRLFAGSDDLRPVARHETDDFVAELLVRVGTPSAEVPQAP